jgi:proline iminopeptidase
VPPPTYREEWCNAEINQTLKLPWVTAEAIGTIRVPVVVLHGERDPRPAGTARQLAASLPRGRYLELPGVGHYPWLEQAEQFASAMRAALQLVVADMSSGGVPG